MLYLHELARVAMADRERDIRTRSPRGLGLSSGRRHPAEPETSAVEDARATLAQASRALASAARPVLGS